MKDTMTRSLNRLQTSFTAFTPGQKVVAILGTAALLLAGFMVFRWATAPTYAPLFSGLESSDASAIIDELEATGTPYQLSDGGGTIMVPRDQVYDRRIALSGEGLPSGANSGYSILDGQDLSTSQFQEQTDFKRAMEGELSNTIEAIDGVQTAVVHLAMPQKSVFSDEQQPTTASVLVQTRAGSTLNPEQVQAVVNLVSSSIDGLDTDQVTVADSTGRVLSAPGTGSAGGASTQTQQVEDFQGRMSSQVQSMLDRVLGQGNSTVQVTADLSFDKTVSETTRYFGNADRALSYSETTEEYNGAGAEANGVTGGVVGPDGQMEEQETDAAGADGEALYSKSSRTADTAMNRTVEHREAAPGGVESLHVGVVLDTQSLKGIDPADVEALVASTLGIQENRGDTVEVSSMPFDRTAELAAAEELEAGEAAEKSAEMMAMIRNGGMAGLVVLILLAAWLSSRKRAKARVEATSYVVEQLKREASERPAEQAVGQAPAMLALEAQEDAHSKGMRDEIAALVERQPEDVAALLRGWLTEKV